MNGKTLEGFAFTDDTIGLLSAANTDTFTAVAHAAAEARELKNGRLFKEACRKVADIRMANGCFEAAYNTAKVLIRAKLPSDATQEERDKSDTEYYGAIVAAMEKARDEKAAAAREAYNARKEAKAKKEAEDKAAAEKAAAEKAAAESAEKAKTERQRLEETRAAAVERMAFFANIVAECDKKLTELAEKEAADARANIQASTAIQDPPPALKDAVENAKAELAKQAGMVTDGVDIGADFAKQRAAVHAAKRAKKVRIPA